MNRTIYLLTGILYFLLLVSSSAAQGLTPGSEYVHEYARPGRPTIDVFVWGSVATPGVWKVEPDVDLLELLSIVRVGSGGNTDVDMILHIYRTVGGQRSSVYTERLEFIIGEGRGYPMLQDGDILEVEAKRRRRVGLGDVARVIGSLASLTLLILRIVDR